MIAFARPNAHDTLTAVVSDTTAVSQECLGVARPLNRVVAGEPGSPRTVDGPIWGRFVGPFKNRTEALQAEREWLSASLPPALRIT